MRTLVVLAVATVAFLPLVLLFPLYMAAGLACGPLAAALLAYRPTL